MFNVVTETPLSSGRGSDSRCSVRPGRDSETTATPKPELGLVTLFRINIWEYGSFLGTWHISWHCYKLRQHGVPVLYEPKWLWCLQLDLQWCNICNISVLWLFAPYFLYMIRRGPGIGPGIGLAGSIAEYMCANTVIALRHL